MLENPLVSNTCSINIFKKIPVHARQKGLELDRLSEASNFTERASTYLKPQVSKESNTRLRSPTSIHNCTSIVEDHTTLIQCRYCV